MKQITSRLSPHVLDSDRDHIRGNPHGSIQILEYGDFQCPYCRLSFQQLHQIQPALGKQLSFAFRHFPLPKHEFAALAAQAAEAAAAQGHFWEMHDALFENQEELSSEEILELADQLDLDSERVFRELENGEHRIHIEEDFDLGQRGGVDGTPMFFVNGHRFEEELSVEAILALTRDSA